MSIELDSIPNRPIKRSFPALFYTALSGAAVRLSELGELSLSSHTIQFSCITPSDSSGVHNCMGIRTVIALNSAGEQASAKTGIRNHGHLICTIPITGILVVRAGDRYTSATPRILYLFGKAKVGAGNTEGNQVMLVCIFICFGNTLMGPVGATESADLTSFLSVWIRCCHDKAAGTGGRLQRGPAVSPLCIEKRYLPGPHEGNWVCSSWLLYGE